MYTALERGLSFGEYTKYLVANKQIYKQLLRYKSLKYQSILSGSDLPYQIIIPNSNKNDSFLYYYVKSENKFLIRIARDYLEDNPNFQSGNYNECLPLFAKSFGEKESTIKSVTDFNCELIYDQVAYFRSVFTNEERHLKCAIQFLCYFYRWLVTKYEQKNFFSNSTRITRTLLFQTTFLKWLKEGYHFVNFNSSTIPSGHSKIVYITMGWDRFSTRCASEGSFSVDLTSLSSPAYRELVLLYLVSATSVFTVISLLRPLVKGLEALYKIKTGEEYSYQDIKFLSIDEAR